MDNFFRDRYFQSLTSQMNDLKQAITDLQREVFRLKSRVAYMYGFAAALGFAAIVGSVVVGLIFLPNALLTLYARLWAS